MAIKQIKFSQNFNKKLDCEYFTTIRPQLVIYKLGVEFDIILNNRLYKRAKIDIIQKFNYSQFTEFVAKIDTGMSLSKLYNLLYFFYKDRAVTQDYYLILFKTTETRKEIDLKSQLKLNF